MAKRQRVNEASSTEPSKRSFDPLLIATGLLGGLYVYLTYYPSDSVSVEDGDGLCGALVAIAMATFAIGGTASKFIANRDSAGTETEESVGTSQSSRWLDWTVWALAVWMMIAAFGSSPPGNLRSATNEAWIWLAGAAAITGARRVLSKKATRQTLLLLMTVCGTGLAVHGFHQNYFSLPAQRAEYREDPERILALIGIDAPPGSAERMVFENRLYDGGPTGTFALANSLAAILLTSAIIALGMLRFHYAAMDWPTRVAWGIAFLLCAGCLIATRSRTAVVALVFAAIITFIVGSRLRQTQAKGLMIGLALIVAVSIIGVVGIATLGNPEWFEEAPASLAFRFQYWRSTMQMVLDRPLFGAGPGNFQAIYDQYREPSANEQIAEPHNFVFETVGSGGLIALLILLATMAIAAANALFRFKGHEDDAQNWDAKESRWLWLGALLAFALVWLIGLAVLMTPDLIANLFAVPTAVFLAIVLVPSMLTLRSRDGDWIVAISLLALLLHLTVSGGWTIPGVAMVVWLLTASLTRIERVESNSKNLLRMPGLAVTVVGLILLGSLYLVSYRPVQSRETAVAKAFYAQNSGQVGQAKASFAQAIEADPWSPEPTLWLADLHRVELVSSWDRPQTRAQWERLLEQTKERGGESPSLYRMIGAQQLHIYQRYGKRKDLDAATKTFSDAASWSPASQWLAAQMAVIAEAQGDLDQAKIQAQKAENLSKLGSNIERSLDRQQIYVPKPLGQLARRGPIRRPASELLSNQIGAGDVDGEK